MINWHRNRQGAPKTRPFFTVCNFCLRGHRNAFHILYCSVLYLKQR